MITELKPVVVMLTINSFEQSMQWCLNMLSKRSYTLLSVYPLVVITPLFPIIQLPVFTCLGCCRVVNRVTDLEGFWEMWFQSLLQLHDLTGVQQSHITGRAGAVAYTVCVTTETQTKTGQCRGGKTGYVQTQIPWYTHTHVFIDL